jgi:hypothetical protein
MFFTACSKWQDDGEIRKKISGIWQPNWNPDFSWKLEDKTNGGNFCQIYSDWTNTGTWQVNKGILVVEMTNTFGAKDKITVEKYKIVKIEDHEIVLLQVGADKFQALHKK